MVCGSEAPCPVARRFQAQLQVTDLGDRSLLTAGFHSMLHLHTIAAKCVLEKIVSVVNPKTKHAEKAVFVRSHAICTVVISVKQTLALERFADTP